MIRIYLHVSGARAASDHEVGVCGKRERYATATTTTTTTIAIAVVIATSTDVVR